MPKNSKFRLGQIFSVSAITRRILAAENSRFILRNFEAAIQLRDKNCSTMVQASVQALKYRLCRKIKLVKKNPVSGF